MTTLTVIGNLAADVELNYTGSGTAVATFRILENRHRRHGEQWVELEPNAYNVRVWGQQAENVAASVGRGARVSVSGTVETESWTSEAGEKRSRQIIEASEVSASMRWAQAAITKNPRNGRARESVEVPAPEGWRERAHKAPAGTRDETNGQQA